MLSALKAVHGLLERDLSKGMRSALGGRPCKNEVWVPAKELQAIKEELETVKACLTAVHQAKATEKTKLEELYKSMSSVVKS